MSSYRPRILFTSVVICQGDWFWSYDTHIKSDVQCCFYKNDTPSKFPLPSIVSGFGALTYIQGGAKLAGGLFGGVGVCGSVLFVKMALKLRNCNVVWEEVNSKRNQYRQISERLESLKAMVEEEAKLTRPRSWRECLFACCTRT